MAAALVQIRGLGELVVALKTAEPALRKELRALMRRGAGKGVAAARANAPVASGTMAGTTGVRMRAKGAAVGTPTIQGPIVHFGRAARISGGKVSAHIRNLNPQRWLIDPVERTAPEIEAEVTAGVQQLLNRTVGAA